MNRLLDEIISHKKHEIEQMVVDGKRARRIHKLRDCFKNDINIIAEIKESSPSAGLIRKINLDEIVPIYKKYASAISVLTDEKFFSGSFERLKNVCDMVDMPVLCKDFIIDKIQIDKAYSCGADVVLLIVRILGYDKLKALYEYTKELGMDAIVEIHNIDEAEMAKELHCDIVGVNSRDLDTLDISLDRALSILKMLDKSVLKIAESGIRTKDDIEYLKGYCNGFLIGEHLLKGDIEKNLKNMTGTFHDG